MDLIKKEFEEAAEVLKAFKEDYQNMQLIDDAAEQIKLAFQNGNKLISCGNGGSMCDAMHLAEELTGKFRNERQALPAVAISDGSYLSCAANDFGYDRVFERFVEGLGNEADILVGITTSGNSPNVLKAFEVAKQKGMFNIALTGKDGGKAAHLADIELRAPSGQYADRAQEIHIKVIHSIINAVENKLGMGSS